MAIGQIVLAAHWGWLTAAALLAIAELVAPGVFLIWIAAAALVTGIATIALGLALPMQVVLFAGVAVGAVYAARRWLRANPIVSADPLLNDRVARLIGEIVVVVEPVDAAGGRVRVGDGVWNARGAEAAVGSRVRIVGAESGCLLVEPA